MIREYAFAVLLFTATFGAASAQLSAAPKPAPTHSDISYGSSPHQLLDIHLPTNGAGPFPVLIWYGGIWQPSKHVPDLDRFLPQQIAVIGVETRTLTDGMQEKADPIYFENNWGLTQPENVGEMDYKVHSPAWALGFQELARKAGAVCHVKYPDHPTDVYNDIWDFIVKELKSPDP